MIDKFQGEFRWLSNFWPCEIVLDGEVYPSVEHAYQAAKTNNIANRKIIQSLKSPGAAKKMGKVVTMRANWDSIKLRIMEDLVRQKFIKDARLKIKLLSTGEQELVERNHWNDQFWGVCNGVGENHLGRIIMKVRKGLSGS